METPKCPYCKLDLEWDKSVSAWECVEHGVFEKNYNFDEPTYEPDYYEE